MTERDVELLLQRTAASMVYPPTPQLRARIVGEITRPPGTVAQPRRRPALAFATIAVVLAAFAAMIALAVPGSRSAIADFFGIERSKIERLPTPAVSPTPFPPGGELPADARPASVEEATTALGFSPASPSFLGELEAIYLLRYAGEQVAILRYADLDVWQARPRGNVFVKGVPEGVIVLELRTPGGRDAYFIEGGSHVVRIVDESGDVPGSERTVTRNTLIFGSDHAFYRIETDLPRSEELLRLADSLP
jgi:hypothetical protein